MNEPDPFAPPERAHLKALWEAYFEESKLPRLEPTYFRRSALIKLHLIGVQPEDVRRVVRWVRAQISDRQSGFTTRALDWRNLMQRTDRFEELWKNLPAPKKASVKPAPAATAALDPDEAARIVAEAKAKARELREQLFGGRKS